MTDADGWYEELMNAHRGLSDGQRSSSSGTASAGPKLVVRLLRTRRSTMRTPSG